MKIPTTPTKTPKLKPETGNLKESPLVNLRVQVSGLKPQVSSSPNMTKQYRKELRALATQIRKAKRDQAAHARDTARHVGRLTRANERAIARSRAASVREIRACLRTEVLLNKGTEKQIAAFQKRQAILIGRLS